MAALGVGVFVLVGFVACGGSDGATDDAAAGDGAALDARVVDAAAPDADLATSIRLTLRDEDSGAPLVGRTVLQHDLTGAVIGRAETSSSGRVVFPGTPSMLTALFDRFDEPVAETIALVDAGDDVVIGPEPPPAPLGSVTVATPGAFAGASVYEFSMGWCLRRTSSGTDSFTVNVRECAIAADGSLHALGVAYDDSDEPVAYSLFEAPAFTTDVVFPAWSTDFATLDVTYTNAPAVSLETGYQFASKDVFFPTGPERVGTAVSLPRPTPLDGGVQFGVGFGTATGFATFLRSQMTVPATIDVDLAAVLPPVFTDVDVDVATDPERPSVAWTVEAGPAADACRVVFRFDDRSWVAVTPGTADPSVTMPQLPADLAAYRPGPGSTIGPVDVWCYRATYHDQYWESIDPDYLPDDGDWEAAIRAIRSF